MDGSGALYIADAGNHRVRKIQNGIITTIAGTGAAGSSSDGDDATTALFNGPNGVAVASDGTVFVADLGNSLVRRLVPPFAAPGATCSFEVTSPAGLVPAAGENRQIAVAAPAGCGWSASSAVPWMTIAPGFGASGGATIALVVSTNTSSAARSAAITVADRSITVFQAAGANRAPLAAAIADQMTAAGAVVALQLAASDPDGDPLVYSATGLPPALTLNSTTGLVSGIVPAGVARRFAVTVTVSDRSASTSKTFTWTIRNINDFNDDGSSDLLWQHATTGLISAWFMAGSQMVGSTLLTPSQVADTNWKIAGRGDFNGDGWADLIWQNGRDGSLSVWYMSGTKAIGFSLLTPGVVADTAWKIVGVGDFNADGRPDLAWQHQTTGLLSVWLMNGAVMMKGIVLTPDRVSDTNWKIVGVGDMDHDGQADLVWQNQATGHVSAWLMAGDKLREGRLLTPSVVADLNWKIRAIADMNGDGFDDLVWQNIANGSLSLWLMNGTTAIGYQSLSPSAVPDVNWKIAGPK